VNLADVHVAVHGPALVAAISGEIDHSNAVELRGAIVQAVSSDAALVALDLTSVDYLDSAGIQLIYHLREDLRARGQILELVIPALSPVNDALRLAGITGELRAVATVEDALARSTEM
jgi:anti-anti-sigma factor